VETRWTRLRRRLRTVPTLAGIFVLAVALSPVLLVTAALADAVRRLSGKPVIVTRLVAFGLLYVVVDMICLVVLFVQWVGSGFGWSRRRLVEGSYRLQEWWANILFGSVRRLFRLRVEVEGLDLVAPGPVIVMMRHASIIDTLLPNVLITRGAGVRLRYVLKKELLADPALDIAGNRLTNHFVDRSGDSRAEIRAVVALTEGMGPADGVLIYPEGTRFTERRLERIIAGLGDGDTRSQRVRALRRVLPPRPGGATALLGTGHDIVVVAHTGLESLATIPDAWSGRIVGSTLKVAMWRYPAASVPSNRRERVDWLFERWEEVDAWIARASPT
jgi:1-acyl-sn-glycerol-3-phosphate acyltransferase